MKIGFTGTQDGMTGLQRVALGNVLRTHRQRASMLRVEPWFMHGDCIGADEQAHYAAKALGFLVQLHPPLLGTKRAFCVGETTLTPARPYLDRNMDIVDATDFLLAAPKGTEELRSGTWSTVRYARRQGKTVSIFWPDGTFTLEGRA